MRTSLHAVVLEPLSARFPDTGKPKRQPRLSTSIWHRLVREKYDDRFLVGTRWRRSDASPKEVK